MTKRFKFTSDEIDYEVSGEYGQGEYFAITKHLPGAIRMMGAPNTVCGITLVFNVPNVDTQDELLAQLRNKFPGLVNFQQA